MPSPSRKVVIQRECWSVLNPSRRDSSFQMSVNFMLAQEGGRTSSLKKGDGNSAYLLWIVIFISMFIKKMLAQFQNMNLVIPHKSIGSLRKSQFTVRCGHYTLYCRLSPRSWPRDETPEEVYPAGVGYLKGNRDVRPGRGETGRQQSRRHTGH